ncbi:DUF397 domain-containing protein [Actinacidiphila sp. ITFR-21]|uniref:DUF397 domain-containing protein n=1 Tax=Actinacidiphila sp. ITFR-21 TaxID=3075199 RepID=UPI00288C338B|nr:DUF397 domain-containing protein [Streptomyces sp. ITFR-21]WNI18142.1 DUF397 domain-containing protein [Streptomyces sp. ITFR-21]
MAYVDFRSARWRKSNVSGETGCVEVALGLPMVGVRDTKDRGTGPILAFSPVAWTSFLQGLACGDFTPDRMPS